MKIYSSSIIKEWETNTVTVQAIEEYELMVKAGTIVANWIDKKLLRDYMKIAVICGSGNNGGDGYVAAEVLRQRKSPVTCFDVSNGKYSPLCEKAKNDFNGEVITVKTETDFGNIDQFDIVIDAILGIGANRAFDESLNKIIDNINGQAQHIMSIDIPSGMLAEEKTLHNTIRANQTLTFSTPKLSFFYADNDDRLGDWIIRSINLDPAFEQKTPCNTFYMDLNFVRGRLKPRKRFSHKGTYGHVLMIGGEVNKAGAILMSARSAYRMGAGLVTIGSCKANRTIVQANLEEAMFISVGNRIIETLPNMSIYSTIGIGPGMGMSDETCQFMKSILNQSTKPLVIDADGLNIIAKEDLIESVPNDTILTPHPKEFDRLFGDCVDDYERRQKQVKMSKIYHVFIILKGAYSSISTPEGKLYFNSTGNPGMACGGSGDILTGMICGLLAQGYCAEESCILATYTHGLAGDLCAKESGEISMIATDILSKFAIALKMIT